VHSSLRRLRLAGLATMAIATTTTAALFLSGGGDPGLAPANDDHWREECSSCHVPYHPGLLPERSWRRIMAGLSQHFGQNAALDEPVRAQIAAFLAAHAADRSPALRSRRIAASVPEDAAPLRFSETVWFQERHDEIPADVWRRPAVGDRANCDACHPDAAAGKFDQRMLHVPR
jgi:hypothetical protein